MAVTVESGNGVNVQDNTTATVNWEVTGSNRVMLVGIIWAQSNAGSGAFVSDVSFHGVALTFLASVANGVTTVEYWYLIAPDTGAGYDLVVNWGQVDSGDPATVIAMIDGINYTGVDQTTPFGTPVTSTGTSSTPSTNVTGVATTNLVVDAVGYAYTTIPTLAAGAGQTEEWNDTITSLTTPTRKIGSGGSDETSAVGTVTMSWAITIATIPTSEVWAQIAVEVLAVSATRIKDVILGPGIIVRKR